MIPQKKGKNRSIGAVTNLRFFCQTNFCHPTFFLENYSIKRSFSSDNFQKKKLH